MVHGNPLTGNAAVTTTNWATGRGFLNKTTTTDTNLNLIDMGAREYDPTLGVFTSVDPLQDPSDPAQWNGYAYTENNPITHSDPTGAKDIDHEYSPRTPSHKSSANGSSSRKHHTGASRHHYWHEGGEDGLEHGGHRSPPIYHPKPPRINYFHEGGGDGLQHGGHTYIPNPKAVSPPRVKTPTGPPAASAGCSSSPSGYPACSGVSNPHSNHTAAKIVGITILTVLLVPETIVNVGQAGLDPLTDGGEVATADADGALIESTFSQDAAEEDTTAACGGESFSADTTVTMGDGTIKPIDAVHIGDKVLATNTATGVTAAQVVTKVWVNHDTDLMDVTVTNGNGTQIIHATQHHLFWDATTNTWTEADKLHAGDQGFAPGLVDT